MLLPYFVMPVVRKYMLPAAAFLIFSVPLITQGQDKEDEARIFNVLDYGAVADGKTLDTEAIQKAIDAATKTGNGARVLIPGGRKYLIGTIELKSGIDFHLQGDAELILSTNREDYSGGAAIVANSVNEVIISGTGSINGRAKEFVTHIENEWWVPKSWRPRAFLLTRCNDLEIRDISINKIPLWTLHMLGCENVLVDGIKINNDMDVPNCDGIDPDHCRNVVIRNCLISGGDDAIVIKTSRRDENYGPSANIHVYDCVLESESSGLKIGTETTQDIYNVVFERCEIKTSCRGLTIQLRDEGSISNVIFRDITFTSQYYSDPWWGRGEAISFTAIPRTPDTKIGTISNVRVRNVTGRAENSIRINGTKESRISNIRFDNVHVTFDRWTHYPGNLFDNRPTKTYPDIEPHDNPGFYIRFSDQVFLNNCSVSWGQNIPDYFSNALKAHDVTELKTEGFKGEGAHPGRDQAIVVNEN